MEILILGKNKLSTRKSWMMQNIIDIIIMRNKYRGKDDIKYKDLKNKVSQKCRETKESWLR